MKLYVTRHGETAMNAAHRVCGRTDIDLTETGVEQAKEAGRKLQGLGIARILVSPMIRAQHTARLIAEEIGFDPEKLETEPRLIEQDYGIYENTDWDGADFKRNKAQFAVRYPGGESMMDLAGRLYPLLDELKTKGGEPTLIVCHGGICRVIRTYFEDLSNEDFPAFRLPNCAILEYDL
ncbi:MAG: histidine phosphatase family protein [Clostridia bacterium]|nr:histidine phosphatase family protein [Clostridia bacterium]